MAANYFDKYDQQAGNYFDKYDEPVAIKPEKTGMLRAAADIPVQVGRGVAVGVKALSDVFGADNPVSRAASGVEDFLGGLLSAQAKNDQAEIARIMKEAEDKGVGDQVAAAVKAFATAPVDMLSQALGTAVPVIAGGLAGSVARLGAAGVGAISAGIGAGMGAGTVKGQIYDAVKQELLANKVPEAEAEKRAQEAQAYGGKNLDQILMGAGIGAAEAAFGAERILTGLFRKGAVKPSTLPAKYRIPTAAATEAVPEMAQAAQEQVAQNIALQREGYDVPTMRGVVGQAALEGLAGAGLGAITGAMQRTEAAKPVTGEAGIVRPEEEVKPLTMEEQRELELQQRLYRPQQPTAEDLLGEVRGQIQTAPPTTPADIARIRDDHETAVINSLLEQDRKMQSVSDLARLNLERMSQTESLEAATKDADRRVREGRLMGRVQSLIDQNIPFASTAIADINRKFEMIGEAPLDDTERARVQNIMTMAQGFTDFVKLPSLPAREQDIFAENQAMQELESRYKEQLQKRLQQESDRQAQLSNKKKQATTQAVLQSIQKRGGIASIDEAEYLQSQGIEGAFVDVDPALGETISVTSKGMEEEISPEEMSYRLAQLKERKPRGQVSPQPVRTETPAPSPVVGQAPVSGRVEEGAAVRPTVSPEPSTTEDRQRAEPVVEAAAPEPVVTEAEAMQPESVVPESKTPTGTPAGWVLRNKETGEVVMETNDPAKVKALNTKKYEAVPILEYLQGLNKSQEAVAEPMLAPTGEVRPEGRVQPEGEGRAAVSDEGVKKPVSIKKEQTDKERQAQINRDRQQAKRAAAEAERAEKERRKAEKEAEAKRKAEAAAARKQAKRLEEIAKKADAAKAALKKQAEEMEARLAELKAREEAQKVEKARFDAEQAARQAEAKREAEEAEAKRKAKKEAEVKAKEAEAKRKAEEAEAKRKAKEAEEAEAQRKLEALPPYEQRVKLSADDLYPQLKDFDSAVNAIYDRASNPAEKEIASLIKSRVAQFKELGFAFSLRVTPEGKMLSSGVRGNSRITFSHIGEATEVAISLNHPSNGEQSGTRWSTVAHELLHAVTQAQIRFAPEGSAAKKLRALFNDVVDYFNARAKAKTLTDFEARIYNGEINALESPDELLTWGLTDKNMQAWLNGIESKKGNFLSRLYDIVANVLGFGKSNSALAELLSVSETLLTEPTDAYVKSANLRGASFGFQENVSDVPNWALGFAEGLPVIWFEKDAALIKAESITGKTIYLVATPEGVSRGDVARYTGNLLPPTRLEEVKGIADTLRAEPEEEIRFMRSAPPPTAAGQQALDTINQLGMGVKEPEKGTLEKAKAKLQQIGEAPAKDTIKDWKKKVSGFMDYVDGKLFSADAPFENKLREGYRRDMKDMKEFIGAQLAISQSQAVNADAVSTRSMLIGKPKFRKDLLKWEAVEDPANEIAKAKILDKIAEKYGLTKEEAVQVAHTYMSAANYEGILERNAANKESKDKVREKARKLDSEIVKLNAEYQKRMDEQREQAETEIAKLQGKIRELKSEGDRESEIADLKDRIGELRKEREPGKLITQLKKEIKALREEHAEQTKEIERLGAADVFVTPEQAAMVQPGLEIANQIPEVKEITALWNQQRENVINVLVETGLWTPKYADAMMDNAAYVPFNREMEEDSDDSPEIMIRGLQVKAKEHKLKGSSKPVANVFENMARWQQYAINRAIRNHKALQMVDAATEMPFGDGMMATKVSEAKRGKNITRVWRDGKQEFYEMADPLFVDAFKSLGAVSIPSVKYFTAIANKLRQFIVLYPMFSVAQLSQDSVAAMFSSGLQPKFALKIPYLAVKHAISTFRGTNNLHNELINFGVVGVRDFNAAVSRDDAAITAGIKMPPGGLQKVKYVLERIAMSADNAVRQAVYEAAMQQPGVTQAEALEKAFEVINFRRRGSSKLVNLIGQTVPFFYAYLSAQRVAYKTITGVGISPVERKAAIETLIYTSAAVMALSFMYAMANGDDEAYEKTPGNIRDRSINIPGTNGFRIPLRPDFFLFPKIIAEHTYHLIAENGFSDPAKFKKAMSDNFFNATLSPNVVPQAFKPAVEIGLNYDFFSGKPIVGFFEQNKEAGRQFNDSTSEFAKMMGGAGLSPQKVDHFIRGYFGTVGGLFLYGTNFFIEGESGVPRPELSFEDAIKTLPGVSALKQKPTENALKVDFYELRDAIEKAKNTYDDIKKRSPEGLQDFIENEENYAKLALEKSVTKIADHLSDIRRTIQQVSAAPEDRFSAAEKQERIKELKEVELQLLKSVNLKEMRAMAKM